MIKSVPCNCTKSLSLIMLILNNASFKKVEEQLTLDQVLVVSPFVLPDHTSEPEPTFGNTCDWARSQEWHWHWAECDLTPDLSFTYIGLMYRLSVIRGQLTRPECHLLFSQSKTFSDYLNIDFMKCLFFIWHLNYSATAKVLKCGSYKE